MSAQNSIPLTEFCAPGTKVQESYLQVDPQVELRLITFTPKTKSQQPPVLFIPGWVSLIKGWQIVLREMTRDFIVYYLETREKVSSVVSGKVDYSVATIGNDILRAIELLSLPPKGYLLFGSSLGATAILECCQQASREPLCLVLVGPNALFQIPLWAQGVIFLFPPRLYLILKPVVKWYLKHFRLDVESDRAQYEKYCRALDAADPWKLKAAALAFRDYTVWDRLPSLTIPTLIIGASKDVMHVPENLEKMVSILPHGTYLDLETNSQTHSADMVNAMRNYLDTLNIEKG
jgi:pimeloyl-ACP methyl ester carboxylesterase